MLDDYEDIEITKSSLEPLSYHTSLHLNDIELVQVATGGLPIVSSDENHGETRHAIKSVNTTPAIDISSASNGLESSGATTNPTPAITLEEDRANFDIVTRHDTVTSSRTATAPVGDRKEADAESSSWLANPKLTTPLNAFSTLVMFITALVTLTYFNARSEKLARWTAAKDFYEQCQARIAANVSDPGCSPLVGKTLEPPPSGNTEFYTSDARKGVYDLAPGHRGFDESKTPRQIGRPFDQREDIMWMALLLVPCIMLLLLLLVFSGLTDKALRWLLSTRLATSFISNSRGGKADTENSALDHSGDPDRPLSNLYESLASSAISTARSAGTKGMIVNRKRRQPPPTRLQGMQWSDVGFEERLQAMRDIVTDHCAMRQYGSAELTQGSVVSELTSVKGPEHSQTLDSVNTMALIYNCQEKFFQARKLQQEVLTLLIKIKKPTHPRVLD